MKRIHLAQLARNLLVRNHWAPAHGKHTHHLFAMAGNAHFLALLDQLDQGREPAFRFVDANGLHK